MVSAYLGFFQGALAATDIPSQAWSRDINAGGYLDGAPVGGFGAGTYTWNFAGDFYLSRLNIAAAPAAFTSSNPYTVDSNCHFYMYQKPSGQAAATYLLNAATLGSNQATYYSLYPKAWVDYHGTDFPCKARVTQFTPLIPGDTTRSSFPEGIYEWDVSNPTCTTTDVAILLTWDNSFGGTNAAVSISGNNTGLVLTRNTGNATSKSQGEFTLAAQSSSGVTVTYESAASVATLQSAFNSAGLLADTTGNNTIGGIAFKVTLSPGQSVKVPLVVAWDIPLAQPGTGAQWYREYTRTYTKTGLNSFSIANDALRNYTPWETSIDTWQAGILSGPYPDWFKQMVFNELYYYVIGGTLWEAGQYGSTSYDAGPDMFGSLESYVYSFYGTSDVRFYGSWALAENWPSIDKQEVEQFCDSVTQTGTQALPRPAAIGTCAHDFGSLNDVFTHWNDYTYRDSTTWKDLNSKLVLMVYRDWELTGKTDSTFLNYCWPAVQVAMAKVHSECVSTGGVTYNLPISNGIDQTYDNLGLTGETAYCGSLFLAACEAAQAIAAQEGDPSLATTYNSWLTLGQGDFETNLWNATGGYYNIDTGSGATGVTRIMSDQLCGEWYAKALGLADVVPPAHALTAWTAVYNNNFSLFDTGIHGVVNVMTSAGAIDTSSSQSEEAWVGTTWGVVAGMVQEGLFNQGVSIGESLYNSIWNTGQMWFRTPEAWMTGLTGIRAPYYMRANCIWSVKHAYDLNPPCSGGCTPIPSPTPQPTATLNCSLTASATPTATNTPLMTSTPTPTASRTATSSATSAASSTRTSTPTATASVTPTATLTRTASASETPSSTPTMTDTQSWTASLTSSPSPSRTPTASLTATGTSSATASPTVSPSASRTATPSFTPTASATATLSSTPTATHSMTGTATPSATATGTPTAFFTASLTPSPSATASFTSSPSPSWTQTTTLTATGTASPTLTPTATLTATGTPMNSPSAISTSTASNTVSATPSMTFSPTSSGTPTASFTPSASTTSTPNPSLFTLTFTPSPTFPPTVIVGNPYPNPSHGPTMAIPVEGPGPFTVEWDVFTTAFRKIAGGSTPMNGNGFVQWDLKDKDGSDAARGLYYIRVQVQAGTQAARKILKVLILR